MLAEKGKSAYMGFLILQLTLIPKTQADKENVSYSSLSLSLSLSLLHFYF